MRQEVRMIFGARRISSSNQSVCVYVTFVVSNKVMPREQRDRDLFFNAGVFCFSGYLYRGAYRVPLFNSSVCLSLYVKRWWLLLVERAVRGRLPQTRDLWKRASMG